MSNLNLLLIFLSWGMNSYILYQYIKKRVNKINALDSHLYSLMSCAVILFILKELFFFLKIHSLINVIMLIVLDIALIGLMGTFFVNRLRINTKEVFGIAHPKRYFGCAALAFFFIFMLTVTTLPDTFSNADSNDTTTHHQKKSSDLSSHKKKENTFKVYKVNIKSISENGSHDYLKVSGTTKAPNSSKIFVSTDNKTNPDTTTDAFNNSDEDGLATVKNNKFDAYVSINYISSDTDYKVGSQLRFLISSFDGIKHDASDDFTDDQLSKLVDASTIGTYKITKAIHKQFKPENEDTDSKDKKSDTNKTNSSVDDSNSYDDDSNSNLTLGQQNAADDADEMSLGGQLSKAQVYKKLTSVEGGNYSPSDAQYGVDQVQEIVWKQNALAKAIKYYQEYGYSDEEIIATLTSSDGGRFTMEEAEYAAENKY